MKPRHVLIARLSHALITMAIISHVSSMRTDDHSIGREDQGTGADNPCKEVWENMTVSTPEGLVLCIVPSEEELTEQLKVVGGYNRHYVAVTYREAEHFEPILPGWDGAATTKPAKPSSSRRCRRHRRKHPIFRRRRNWKKSADLKRELGWHDDDPAVEQGSSGVKQKKNEKSNKGTYERIVLRDEDDVSQRTKRSNEDGIRESTKLACTAKGEAIDGLKQMCNMCQRRTELTADRFPRYISEVTCESASGFPSDGTDYCRPAIGKCVQGNIVFDLLIRTDKYTDVSPPSGMYFKMFKQIWVPYQQKIRSCCECRMTQ